MKLKSHQAGPMLGMTFAAIFSHAVFAAGAGQFPVTGAVGDGITVNTKAIQAAIDQCAAAGGGTVVIPKGQFVSGALFFKPGVDLQLAEGSVLSASTNITDFPTQPHVRDDGHFSEDVVSLLNVDHCDHFRLTGPGTLDGNGGSYWEKSFPSGLPRLCEICDSADVVVSGLKFQDSPQWSLHFYNCQGCVAENCRFEARGPNTDGTDIDSSQDITVRNCYYSVNGDCVCLKGNRFDGLNQQPASLPVQGVVVTDCTFVNGLGALSLGSAATVIRDVEFKNSTVQGRTPMLFIKLRTDTAGQDFSGIHVHDIKLDGDGPILTLQPGHGTQVASNKASHGKIADVTVENITGTFGSFGTFSGRNTDVRDITLRNIDVRVSHATNLITSKVVDLKMKNVNVTTAATPHSWLGLFHL